MAASAAEAQVHGRIVDLRTGTGIAGASVRVVAGDTISETFTATDGGYVLTGLPPAEYAMLVSHPGYEFATVRLLLGERGELIVDVPLLARPIPLSPLLIPVRRTATFDGATAEDSLLAQLAFNQTRLMRPQATSPLADLATATPPDRLPDPGGGRHPHVLHIWGSSDDRGRVEVDGAAINAPLHLGGVLPPLDPQLLAGVSLKTAGASARYDGGTSYIMHFRTRTPHGDRLRSWGELGLLASRIGIEAPFTDGSLMVGARRVNQEVVDALVDQPFEYDYGDALARGEWRTGGDRSVRALVLATRERIRIPRDLGHDRAAWRNIATSLSWYPEPMGNGPRLGATFSRGIADLPLLSAPDGHLEAKLDRSSITAENDWRFDAVGLDAGIELEHLRLARHSEAASDPELPDTGQPVACTPSLPCSSATATNIAAFGDVSWQAASAFALRAGLRTAFETTTSDVQLLPRLALTWAGLNGNTATLSVGRYSQVAAAELTDETITADPGRLRISTEHATQVELRWTRATPALALSALAYVRHDEAGVTGAGRTTPGGEVSWVWTVHGSSLSGGYSFRLRRTISPDSTQPPQHLAFLGLRTGHGPLSLDISGVYGAGVPLTSIVLDGVTARSGFQPMAAEPVDDSNRYVRVDASLSATWTLRFGGRDVRLTPYARLVNALSRHGALFYYQDGGTAGLQPLSALPTMPVVGVCWLF